jgi:hypothetical protein
MEKLKITAAHVARGREMRQIVEADVTRRGLTVDQATEELASYLGIDRESVELAIAIANDADRPADQRLTTIGGPA